MFIVLCYEKLSYGRCSVTAHYQPHLRAEIALDAAAAQLHSKRLFIHTTFNRRRRAEEKRGGWYAGDRHSC